MTVITDPMHVAPPRPPDESARLDALYRSRALSAPTAALDDVAELARQLCGTAIGYVAFLDDEVQSVVAVSGASPFEMDRDHAVCAYTILQEEPLVVPDVRDDVRTRSNARLVGSGLRFYAGAAVRTGSGHAIGTVCVLDPQRRSLTATQLGGLAALARLASTALEAHHARPRLSDRLAAHQS